MIAVFLAAEVALFAASFLVLASVVAADPGLLDGGRLPPGPLIAVLAVPTMAAALVVVSGTALLGDGPRSKRVRRELAIRWKWREIGAGFAIGLGGLALTVPAGLIWSVSVGRDQAQSAVGAAFAGRDLDLLSATSAFLVIWLVAPLCEEVVFRGALWRALEHWRWNSWLIFAVTSVLFSFAHLELLRTPLLLVLSIPIALARMYTGNLLSGVIAHQVNNFLPAITLFLATTSNSP